MQPHLPPLPPNRGALDHPRPFGYGLADAGLHQARRCSRRVSRILPSPARPEQPAPLRREDRMARPATVERGSKHVDELPTFLFLRGFWKVVKKPLCFLHAKKPWHARGWWNLIGTSPAGGTAVDGCLANEANELMEMNGFPPCTNPRNGKEAA